jgi:hypothetical protein
VNQVQTDEELSLATGQSANRVQIPHFIEQIAFVGHDGEAVQQKVSAK